MFSWQMAIWLTIPFQTLVLSGHNLCDTTPFEITIFFDNKNIFFIRPPHWSYSVCRLVMHQKFQIQFITVKILYIYYFISLKNVLFQIYMLINEVSCDIKCLCGPLYVSLILTYSFSLLELKICCWWMIKQ